MKKAFAIALALVLALSMAIFAAAGTSDDLKAISDELVATYGIDAVQDAVEAELAKLNLPTNVEDIDAADLGEGTAQAFAAGLIENLGISDDLAAKLSANTSNDFISFLAGLYVPTPVVITTVPTMTTNATFTTVVPTTAGGGATTKVPATTGNQVKTGSSSTIAIAAFATISVAAAAAFVCLKKKED